MPTSVQALLCEHPVVRVRRARVEEENTVKLIGAAVMALALLGTSTAPVVAQPKATQTVTHVRVFEGPN